MITPEQIEKVLKKAKKSSKSKASKNENSVVPRAPGTLSSHYAPSTGLKLFAHENLPRAIATAESLMMRVAVMAFSDPISCASIICWKQLSENPAECARQLYAAMRELDGVGADYIIVEEPPELEEWMGILDRLRRAANG